MLCGIPTIFFSLMDVKTGDIYKFWVQNHAFPMPCLIRSTWHSTISSFDNMHRVKYNNIKHQHLWLTSLHPILLVFIFTLQNELNLNMLIYYIWFTCNDSSYVFHQMLLSMLNHIRQIRMFEWPEFTKGFIMLTNMRAHYKRLSDVDSVSHFKHNLLELLNTLRLRQNGQHFPDNIFKCIFFNENIWILIKISLKFVPKVLINNIPALVQIMAWRRPGDKALCEPMMVRL